jgi:hypothetical protein
MKVKNAVMKHPVKAFPVTVSIPVKTVYERHYEVVAENLAEAKSKAIEFAKLDEEHGRDIWRENPDKRTSAGPVKAKKTNFAEYY